MLLSPRVFARAPALRVLAPAVLCLLPMFASAATYTVNTSADGDPYDDAYCTLREAISHSQGDIVEDHCGTGHDATGERNRLHPQHDHYAE